MEQYLTGSTFFARFFNKVSDFFFIRLKTWLTWMILVSDCLVHKILIPETPWLNGIIFDRKHQLEINYKENNKHGHYWPLSVYF